MPARLAGQEIHVAFTVTIDFDGSPMLWVSDRNGKTHRITAFKKPADDAPPAREAAWSFADLKAARFYLDQLCAQTSYGCNGDPSEAHFAALKYIERAAQNQLTYELREAAKLSEYQRNNPFACVCRRRFATDRGLSMHVARAKRGTHAPVGVAG